MLVFYKSTFSSY